MSVMRSPTVRRRWLARQLKLARQKEGMTIAKAAKALDMSQSNLSRIENREIGIRPIAVRAALSLYNITGDEAEVIIEVARGAQQRGWWQSYNDVIPDWLGFYVGLEEEATSIETYQSEIVPGLFQTENYAREMFRLTAGDGDLDRKVAVRMRRQEILHRDEPVKVSAVVNEAVLIRPVGSAQTYAEQLNHLLDLSDLPNITIQMLPFASGGHPAMTGPYVILTFPDAVDDPVVYLDNYTVGHVLEEPEYHHWYHQAHQVLTSQALSPESTRDRIRELSGTVK